MQKQKRMGKKKKYDNKLFPFPKVANIKTSVKQTDILSETTEASVHKCFLSFFIGLPVQINNPITVPLNSQPQNQPIGRMEHCDIRDCNPLSTTSYHTFPSNPC